MDRLNDIRRQFFICRGEIIQCLLHTFCAGDNGRNLRLGENKLQRSLRQGCPCGNEFGKLLHQLTAPPHNFWWPAFADIFEVMTFAVTPRKPTRIERYFDNDACAMVPRFLKRRQWFLV